MFAFAARSLPLHRVSLAVALLASQGGLSAAAPQLFGVKAATSDAFSTAIGYDSSIRINGIANDFEFHPAGQLVIFDNDTASLTGMLQSKQDPDLRFLLKMSFTGEMEPADVGYPPVGSPTTDLLATAYANLGGPADPGTWRFFTNYTGSLYGIDAMAGAKLTLARTGASFQIGVGANGRNVLNGAFGSFSAHVTAQPTVGNALADTTGDLHLTLDDADQGACSLNGSGDEYVQWNTFHAFVLLANLGEFQWSAPGLFVEHADGTASVSGLIHKDTDPNKSFKVELQLSSRVDPGDPAYAPPGSPKKELLPSAYINNGGPVDPSTWHYYTSLTGTLLGTGVFTGAELSVAGTGPAVQVGFGANGKNVEYGLSTWLQFTVVSHPDVGPNFQLSTFDGDANLDLSESCDECVFPAVSSPLALYSGNHAFTLYPLGSDFVFDPTGTLQEFGDGTAVVNGVIHRLSHPNEMFAVELHFCDRVNPIDASYPPAGSPKKELVASAYLDQGGTIDPSTWHYYLTTNGTFTGLGAFQGAILNVSRVGPAFQVGFGANGKNANYGGSGWIDLTVVAQPAQGKQFPSEFQGDGNFDLDTDCPTEPAAAVLASEYGPACFGSGHIAPHLSFLGVPQSGESAVIRLQDALGNAPALILIGLPGNVMLPSGCFSNIASIVTTIGPFTTQGGGAGNGSLSLYLTVPTIPSVFSAGLSAIVVDAAAPGGLAVTNGVLLPLSP